MFDGRGDTKPKTAAGAVVDQPQRAGEGPGHPFYQRVNELLEECL